MRSAQHTLTILLNLLLLTTLSAQNYKSTICEHRKTYKSNFLKEAHSPLKTKAEVNKLRFFKPVKTFNITAEFEKIDGGKPLTMPTSSGKEKTYIPYGIASFELNGSSHQLTIYKSVKLSAIPMYKDYLFLPFRDLTTGVSSYGGGRYMDLKTSDIKDGKIVLDFNTCYNPYCAYSDNYNCPIPPKNNDLNVEIKAGEKNYAGQVQH